MPNFSITTDRKAAAKVVLAALDEGSLGCQSPNHAGRYYSKDRSGKEYRCAVGCLYTTEQADKLQRMQGGSYMLAGSLMLKGYLKVPYEDRQWFEVLQAVHDGSALRETGKNAEVRLRKYCEEALNG